MAAERGYDAYMKDLKVPAADTSGKRVAIIGGGPTGISAAFFLGRAGIPVTIFEQADRLGGIVRRVVPDFRISGETVDKDIAMMMAYGAEVKLSSPLLPSASSWPRATPTSSLP